jgi:hypothetical protein
MGWGQGGEMTQALYAHMNNKIKKILRISMGYINPQPMKGNLSLKNDWTYI